MGCVSYNTPLLDHKVASSINTFLDTFDINLKAAGLVRQTASGTYTDSHSTKQIVDFDPVTFDAYWSTIVISNSTSWYQTQYLCSLRYKLPVGNGNIIFADDLANPPYKKITHASYDSTEVYIQFDFVYNAMVTNAGTTLNTRFILCYASIYDKNNLLIANCGTGYVIYPQESQSLYKISGAMEGKSYISLTQNSLTITMGCHFLSGTASYNNNNFRKYMVNFTVYRKNGNIYVYMINGGASNQSSFYDYYIDDRSDIALRSYNSENNKVTAWYNRDGNFLYWPIGISVVSQTANFNVVGKVYAMTDTQDIQHIPELAITRFMETNTREFPSVYKINNNLVLGNYVNLGLTERAQCPVVRSSKLYSWAFLYEEDTIYTTDLL